MRTLALAEMEVVRFLRRRSTLWICTLGGTMMAAIFSIWVSHFLLEAGDAIRYRFFWGPWSILEDLERLRGVLWALEVVALVVLANLLAKRTLQQEMEDGTMTMLLQTPLPLSRVLLGKATGVAVTVLAVHSTLTIVLLVPTPFINRSHATVLAEFVLVAILALGEVPEGFGLALVKRRKGRAYLLFRLGSVARIVVPVVILHFLIEPESRASGTDIWDVTVQFWNNLKFTDATPATSHFSSPWLPLVVVFAWHIASALLLWRFVVRSELR